MKQNRRAFYWLVYFSFILMFSCYFVFLYFTVIAIPKTDTINIATNVTILSPVFGLLDVKLVLFSIFVFSLSTLFVSLSSYITVIVE